MTKISASGAPRIPEAVAEELLETRRAHPDWGPKKLLARLRNRQPRTALPNVSRVANLLHRHGLVAPKRRHRGWDHPGRPILVPAGPNDLWTADFKGQFRTRDGEYVYPLTIVDGYSRYLLACQGLRSTAVDLAKLGVQAAL